MFNNGLILPGDLLDSVSPINWEHPLNSGLLADYSVIAGGGLMLRNLVGVMPNGTLNFGPIWLGHSDRPGGYGCLSFDGTDDYVDASSLMNTSEITFSVWIKAVNFSKSYNAIVSRGNTTDYSQILVKSTGKLAPYIRTVSGNTVAYDGTGVNTLVVGKWYHLALTYNSVNGLAGYVNGALDGSASANGSLSTTPLPTIIGNWSIGLGGREYAGLIDGVRIYNRALSAREVASLYAEQASGNPNIWNWQSTRTFFLPLTTPAVAILDGPCPGTPRDSWSGNQTRSYSVTAGDVILIKLSGTDFTADVTATMSPTISSPNADQNIIDELNPFVATGLSNGSVVTSATVTPNGGSPISGIVTSDTVNWSATFDLSSLAPDLPLVNLAVTNAGGTTNRNVTVIA